MVQLFPGIPPSCLCDMYLNSSINEGLNLLIRHHMKKGKIDGWILNHCIPSVRSEIIIRVYELHNEAIMRGKRWNYAILDTDIEIVRNYPNMDDVSYPRTQAEITKSVAQTLLVKCQNCKRREKCKEVKKCDQRLREAGLV